jgi:hypothetical protein
MQASAPDRNVDPPTDQGTEQDDHRNGWRKAETGERKRHDFCEPQCPHKRQKNNADQHEPSEWKHQALLADLLLLKVVFSSGVPKRQLVPVAHLNLPPPAPIPSSDGQRL